MKTLEDLKRDGRVLFMTNDEKQLGDPGLREYFNEWLSDSRLKSTDILLTGTN